MRLSLAVALSGVKRRDFVITEGATLTGRVVREGKPLANEHVQLEFRVNPVAQRFWFNLPSTRTDDEGRFFIGYVPPGHLHISTRIPIERTIAFTTQPQRRFDARPGQEIDLGDVDKTERGKVETPRTRSRP